MSLRVPVLSEHHMDTSLEIGTGHLCPRRPWFMTIRQQLRSQGAASSCYSQARRSLLKNVSDNYHRGTALVVSRDIVSTEGTLYTNLRDANDQVPEINTKRITIHVTSGIYEEKVIIPATEPNLTLEGEGRNRTAITWHNTTASAGTLTSASVIVECDQFIARDISFRVPEADCISWAILNVLEEEPNQPVEVAGPEDYYG